MREQFPHSLKARRRMRFPVPYYAALGVCLGYVIRYTKSERFASAMSSLMFIGSKVWFSEEMRLRT